MLVRIDQKAAERWQADWAAAKHLRAPCRCRYLHFAAADVGTRHSGGFDQLIAFETEPRGPGRRTANQHQFPIFAQIGREQMRLRVVRQKRPQRGCQIVHILSSLDNFFQSPAGARF